MILGHMDDTGAHGRYWGTWTMSLCWQDDTSLWGYWPLTSPTLELNAAQERGSTSGDGDVNAATVRGGDGTDGAIGVPQGRQGVTAALWNLSLEGELHPL